MSISQKDLFARLVTLFGEQLVLNEDISQLKKDAKFHKDDNPNGIAAEDIKLIVAAAKLEASSQFEEFTAKNAAVKAKFEELTNYND